MTMRSLHVPRHVHWAEDDSGSVTVLNEHTGQWHLLNPTAAFTWHMARDDRPAAEVITALAARYPEVPQERIREDFEELLGDLRTRGLISIETDNEVVNAWNETSMALEVPATDRVGARYLVAVALALPIAMILSRLPFRWVAQLIRSVKQRLPCPEATIEEADALARVAQRVARWYPGRVACWEQSLIVMVAARFYGRSLTLHLGTATDPRRFHAWIEVRGQVLTVDRDPCPQSYRRVFVI